MTEQDDAAARALASARAALALALGEPAQIWSVASIRSGRPGFFLIVFGAPEAAVGLAAVDRASGEVLAKSRLPGRMPHRVIAAEQAIEQAGLGADTEAVLVWDAVPASRSPFYPLWQLRSGGQTVWVNSVTGAVCKSLDATKGGGEASN